MYWAVTRTGGVGWDDSRGLREQDLWDEHARYMDALEDEGFLLLAGPVGRDDREHRVTLVVEADDEEAIHVRLADDPWTPTDQLRTVAVEPWQVLIGAQRLR